MLRNCCCLSLHNGGLIISWLGIIGSILYGILGTIGGQYIIEYGENQKLHGHTYIDRLNGQTYIEQGQYLTISLVAGSIFSVIVSGLGVYGIANKKDILLLPWVVLNGFGIFSSALTVLIISVVMLVTLNFAFFFYALLLGGLCLVPSIYLWLVMYSLYKEIRVNRIYSRSEINTYVVGYPNIIKV